MNPCFPECAANTDKRLPIGGGRISIGVSSIKEGLNSFILLTAFLNAVLRPSAGSNITLFRVLLPLAVVLIAVSSIKVFRQMMVGFFLLVGLAVLQHAITHWVFYPGISFDWLYLAEYLFHYGSILILFSLIRCQAALKGRTFYDAFSRFLIIFAKTICLFLFFYTVIMGRPLMSISRADNINNMGCLLTAGACLILADSGRSGRKWQFLWVLLIVFLLYYNDSKAALFGALLICAIYAVLWVSRFPRGREKLAIRRVFLFLGAFAVAFIIALSPSIHGYSLRGLILDPIRRVLANNPYPMASTSITYRTNSTIAALNIIRNTGGIGVGIGNTARVLKHTMVNVYESWASSRGYSLHNWWLELITDFGYPAIILELYLFFKSFSLYMLKGRLSLMETAKVLFFLSFPIWSISASGLTTEYYTLSVLLFLMLEDSNDSNRIHGCNCAIQ